MCKRAFILILVVAIGAVVFVRVRSIARSRTARLVRGPHPASTDVGAAMRRITGTDPVSVKPWVIDDVAFRNAYAGRQWIVGRSDQPATTGLEAIASARADAARQLYPILRSRVREWPRDQRWLQARVEADVDAGRLDSDTFVERFDRPYGTVYAGAVLVDASADHLQPVIHRAATELRVRHRRAGALMALAGALLIVTWLAYALLNSVTRGYITARLRVMAGIATIVSVGILLLV
ncbi:MAG TPA: hypothetical protein VGI81_24360 [Tepidisphaeraceae bacterium]|jgi:hypothetical protein